MGKFPQTALLHHKDSQAKVADEVGILLDEEDANAGLPADLRKGFVERGGGGGVESGAGFVKDKEFGLLIESETQGELVALAAAQSIGALLGRKFTRRRRGRSIERFLRIERSEAVVFLDGKMVEQGCALHEEADAFSGEIVCS